MLAARRSVWTKRPTSCSRRLGAGLLIYRNARPQDGDWDQFDCGDEFGLIPGRRGSIFENGPDDAAINREEFVSLRDRR